VVRLSALATLLPEKKLWFFIELEAWWVLEFGCFGEEIVLLLLPRCEPQIFQYISQSLY
jgi:hypothetical protein